MDYIHGGYIVLARKIRKSPLWLSMKATHRVVLLEILLQAQFQDTEVALNGEVIFLRRGQLATSYQKLVDDITDKAITVKVVRHAINKLVKYGFLSKDESKARAKKGLLLTITNYDFYQNPKNYRGINNGKKDDNTWSLESQSEGKAWAINNKDKNVKEFNNQNMNVRMEGVTYGPSRGNYENSQNKSLTGGKVGRIIEPNKSTKRNKHEYF
ncbi:hypothetical protein [Anaerobacillus alkalidiazotrophicus]|uniref:hypothetical protein n=1 Tax=Anaerobacillus alkalidiazotrophicus TaxID=472963 RepID=UPI000A00EE81|nr:hypothetical protein [Anaerobacillus alkalidiazotrophicus]